MGRVRVLLLLAGWGVLGAACAGGGGAPAVTVTVSCPPLKTYALADERALGAAVAALPPGSPLIGAMADYGALRAADRACRAAAPAPAGGGAP